MADESHNTTLSNILRIAVGSTNPAKIQAVTYAIQRCIVPSWEPDQIQIESFNVESGVPSQPFGNQQTIDGAKSRAKAAYDAFIIRFQVRPHLAIAMEGGLEWVENISSIRNPSTNHSEDIQSESTSLFCMAWIAVHGMRDSFVFDILAEPTLSFSVEDMEPVFGVAKSAMFALPHVIVEEIRKGSELGAADDKVFARSNSKHGSSTVGKVTKDLINRTLFYEHAIILAMTPWFRPDLYPVGH